MPAALAALYPETQCDKPLLKHGSSEICLEFILILKCACNIILPSLPSCAFVICLFTAVDVVHPDPFIPMQVLSEPHIWQA